LKHNRNLDDIGMSSAESNHAYISLKI
jgi:hypothetical protein